MTQNAKHVCSSLRFCNNSLSSHTGHGMGGARKIELLDIAQQPKPRCPVLTKHLAKKEMWLLISAMWPIPMFSYLRVQIDLHISVWSSVNHLSVRLGTPTYNNHDDMTIHSSAMKPRLDGASCRLRLASPKSRTIENGIVRQERWIPATCFIQATMQEMATQSSENFWWNEMLKLSFPSRQLNRSLKI